MAPTCALALPRSGRLVVKHTFLEVVETPVNDAKESGGAAFYRRASSDSALYNTCVDEEAREQQASAAAAAASRRDAEEEQEPTFEITGLSDTETDEAGASMAGEGALLCYMHMDDDEPPLLSAASATSSSRTPSDSGAASAPPLPEGEQGSNLDKLMSENARLIMENELLRENMRLAQEIQEMKQQAAAQASMAEDVLGHAAYEFSGQAWCVPMVAAAIQPQQPTRPPQGRATQQQQQQQQQRRGGARAATGIGSSQALRGAPAGGPTTVMLRNLPNNYTRAMVLAMLDEEGFQGLYDFLYLPTDFNSRACLGYAFVNLADPSSVPVFWETFDGFAKWILPSRKVCRVSWSGPHQGLEAHVNRYRNSPVMHESVPDEFKPVLFQDGVRIIFPAPTKAPRAPRVRHREATARADGRR